jgi:hypothetical protein
MWRAPGQDAPVLIGPGATRWCWLLLAAMLAVAVPTAADAGADDGWTAQLCDPAEEGDGLSRAASLGLVRFASGLSAPSRVDAAGPRAVDDPVTASWIGLSPTDRSPPRV